MTEKNSYISKENRWRISKLIYKVKTVPSSGHRCRGARGPRGKCFWSHFLGQHATRIVLPDTELFLYTLLFCLFLIILMTKVVIINQQ